MNFLSTRALALEISSTRSTGARVASAATPPHTAQHLLEHGVSLTRQRYAMHRTAQTHHQGAPPHAHTERNVPRCPMTNTGRSPWCQPEALWTRNSRHQGGVLRNVPHCMWTLRRALHYGSRVSLCRSSGPLRSPLASQCRTGAATNTHACTRTLQRHPPTSQTDR